MIRIWSDGKHTRVIANGYDITDDVVSVEWTHAEPDKEPEARITVRAVALEGVTNRVKVVSE